MEVLASRKVGKTTLVVTPGRGTLHRLLGRESDITGYNVMAAATKSREARFIAKTATLAQAQAYIEAYSPRYGLLSKG